MAFSVKSKDVINYKPTDLKKFHLYTYEYIDNLEFLKHPAIVLKSKEKAEKYINVCKKIFKKHYWDGDGKIMLMWVPPFCIEENDFVREKDWQGVIVWFVKQESDGISWLLSPKKLLLKNGL